MLALGRNSSPDNIPIALEEDALATALYLVYPMGMGYISTAARKCFGTLTKTHQCSESWLSCPSNVCPCSVATSYLTTIATLLNLGILRSTVINVHHVGQDISVIQT